MTAESEQQRVTHFKLGEIDGPVLRGPLNQQHDYSFPLEMKRPGHLKDESTRAWVRFRSIQVVNRNDVQVAALARWIAEVKLFELFARSNAAPAAVFEVTDEEAEEFFRDVDPQKVGQNCDRWLEVPPRHRKAGF